MSQQRIGDQTNSSGDPRRRTLLGKIDGSDRTSVRLSKHRKVEIDRKRITAEKSRKRTRDALPKRLHDHDKKTAKLLAEAKRT